MRRHEVIEGVSQVVVEVDDQDRALKFWTETIEFELVQDAPYGDAGRWIEVRTRDRATSSCSGLGRATVRPRPTSCLPRTPSSTATTSRAPTRSCGLAASSSPSLRSSRAGAGGRC